MSKQLISANGITSSIRVLRGQNILLDFDLAALYGVTTKALNQAVKRNAVRFPADFMFQLSGEEAELIGSQFVTLNSLPAEKSGRSRSQIVTLKRGRNLKYRPYAFTEEGVAMLSSVLRSQRAVQVNIAIMRAFVQLRSALESNRELARRFSELEKRVGKQDQNIAAILEAIRQLIEPPAKSGRQIGFHVRETSPRYGTRRTR